MFSVPLFAVAILVETLILVGKVAWPQGAWQALPAAKVRVESGPGGIRSEMGYQVGAGSKAANRETACEII